MKNNCTKCNSNKIYKLNSGSEFCCHNCTHQFSIDRVVFRTFKDGDVIALFPYDIITPAGHCNSYQRIGQHGAANYTHCIKITRPAKASEFESLAKELTRIGYNLEIRARK